MLLVIIVIFQESEQIPCFLFSPYLFLQTTSAKYCRDPKAASYDASTYYCLLKSTRKYDELIGKYNTGEDSLKKAAERVGLKLPEIYDETAVNKTIENDAKNK